MYATLLISATTRKEILYFIFQLTIFFDTKPVQCHSYIVNKGSFQLKHVSYFYHFQNLKKNVLQILYLRLGRKLT